MPIATDAGGACRILVWGVTGSGKSTAAKRIAARTGLPLIPVDELTWEPGWVPVPIDRQRELFSSVVARCDWVLDTAYSSWLDVVLSRTDLIVALDYPRWFSLQRLLRRTVLRAITKRTVCNGNTESLGNLCARDSILRWHFQTFDRKRARAHEWAQAGVGPPVLIIRRPRDLDKWMNRFE